MRPIRNILKPSIAGTALLLLAACGGSSETGAAPGDPAGQAAIEVTANDQMKFSQSEIRVKAGQTVTLRLVNVGKMPKQAMSHNWVLLQPMSDGELNSLGMKAANNPPSYLPGDQSAIIAHTAMLGSGESDTIEFIAPPVGAYPFICTFPGHYAIMRGNLVSE